MRLSAAGKIHQRSIRIVGTLVIVQPIDYLVLTWIALALLSTAYVAWDQFRGNPEPAVMKWGFVLTTLYMGPIGLLLYVLSDKEPRPGTHEQFTASLPKQGIGSTIHCVAGDATGIVLAAVVTISLGLPMWIDLIVEYLADFAFGLFIFQSLFMKRMMGGSYWQNVRRTFVPELISMNAMMAGMAPVMSFLMMGRDMRAMEPWQPLFWFVMSLGVIVGFAVAYPFNLWMVAKGLKHGLMTERSNPGGLHEHTGHDAPTKGHRRGDKEQTPGHGKMELPPAFAPTVAQQAAMAGGTAIMLLLGMIVPAFSVNLALSVDDVGGVIMPPGMIMDFNTPAEAMRSMGAVHPDTVTYRAPADAKGDQPLKPRSENGVKVFDIETSVIRWNILRDVTVDAFAYNGQIPGPRLELTQGDRVRINFRNSLPESTTVHWHGLILANEMDGPANITQPPVQPGGTYTYEFTAEQAGTFFYHSHDEPDRQQALGLYGALLIAPRDAASIPGANYDIVVQLQEWLKREWLTYPAMLMEGGLPNFFTINGKAYPSTDTIRMRVGETLKVRFVGSSNNFIHPMHIHGGPFEIVAVDGETLNPSARYRADTVNVGPGQRFDVIWTARQPGKWLLHCHIPHHTENNNVETEGGGGLTMIIDVSQ
jgi:FtsP/CotA-like multicopper oxidase with cupredoxin domain